MPDSYRVKRQNDTYGPYTSAELKQLAQSGHIAPSDLVQKDGTNTWKAAGEIKSLFPKASHTQPPPIPTDTNLVPSEATNLRRPSKDAPNTMVRILWTTLVAIIILAGAGAGGLLILSNRASNLQANQTRKLLIGTWLSHSESPLPNKLVYTFNANGSMEQAIINKLPFGTSPEWSGFKTLGSYQVDGNKVVLSLFENKVGQESHTQVAYDEKTQLVLDMPGSVKVGGFNYENLVIETITQSTLTIKGEKSGNVRTFQRMK